MNKSTTNQSDNQLFSSLFFLTSATNKQIEVIFIAPVLSSEDSLILLRGSENRVGSLIQQQFRSGKNIGVYLKYFRFNLVVL